MKELESVSSVSRQGLFTICTLYVVTQYSNKSDLKYLSFIFLSINISTFTFFRARERLIGSF